MLCVAATLCEAAKFHKCSLLVNTVTRERPSVCGITPKTIYTNREHRRARRPPDSLWEENRK